MSEIFFGTEPIAWVQHLFGLGNPLPFRILSLLGDTWGMILVTGVALWLFGREAMYAVVGIITVGAAAKLLLSQAFYQTRPVGPGIVVYEQLSISSFPSGHVFEAALPWALLWMLGDVPLLVPAAVVVLVALGRLYLGVHFVGDVLGGILFALPLVWAYGCLWPRALGWLRRREPRFYFAAALLLLIGAAVSLPFVQERPRRFEIVGLVMGACAGLPLEYWLVRYRRSGAGMWGVLAVGIGGIALFLVAGRLAPERALFARAAAAGLATLWAVFFTPAAIGRWRRRTRRPARERDCTRVPAAQRHGA